MHFLLKFNKNLGKVLNYSLVIEVIMLIILCTNNIN
jgi:hypothetical protein